VIVHGGPGPSRCAMWPGQRVPRSASEGSVEVACQCESRWKHPAGSGHSRRRRGATTRLACAPLRAPGSRRIARCAGLRRPESQGSDRPGTGTACVETSRGRLAGDSAPRTGIFPPAAGAHSDIRHAAVTAVDAVDVRRVRRRCGVRRPTRASAACAIRPTSQIPPVGHRWVHCRLVPLALGR